MQRCCGSTLSPMKLLNLSLRISLNTLWGKLIFRPYNTSKHWRSQFDEASRTITLAKSRDVILRLCNWTLFTPWHRSGHCWAEILSMRIISKIGDKAMFWAKTDPHRKCIWFTLKNTNIALAFLQQQMESTGHSTQYFPRERERMPSHETGKLGPPHD